MSTTTHICPQCGATFLGGPNAKRCPACRTALQRARSSARKRIGDLAQCAACGASFVIRSNAHCYCANCAAERVREQGRGYAERHREQALERRRAYNRAYYEAHRAQEIERAKRYYRSKRKPPQQGDRTKDELHT